MPSVRLSFSPAPAHVRTARLVGVAVARRVGVAEELLEEIRLAIGEACSRAVALHRSNGLSDLIDVAIVDDEQFTVRVVDRAPVDDGPFAVGGDPRQLLIEAGLPSVGRPDALVEEAVVAGMSLALLAGLVDDLDVLPVRGGFGTEVRMSWPLKRHVQDDDEK